MKSGGQCDVFHFGCAEHHQWLHFKSPDDRTACIKDNVTGSRKSTKWVLRLLMMPRSGPVRIYVALQAAFLVGVVDHPLIFRVEEISANSFQGLLMTAFRVIGELRALLYCESNIRANH